MLVKRRLDRVGETLEVLLGERLDQRLLRREMAIDGADADARAAGDVLDLRLQADLGEGGGGGGDDLLAIAARIGAQGPSSDG